MEVPMERGLPIDARRYSDWEEKFEGYRRPISQGKIQRWLEQFDAEDQDTAARLLDSVAYFSLPHISAAYRQLLAALPGWSENEAHRAGKWRFVPFSGSVGESGDSMVHEFRIANRMTSARYKEMFIHRSDLVRENLTADDTVVLIDDFSGTGQQATEAWGRQFSELLFSSPRVYLILVAADYRGIEKVTSETPIEPAVFRIFDRDDNLKSTPYFDDAEKETIEGYCKKANPSIPLGYGELGIVAVFHHRCPNSSLAVLHSRKNNWEPLFPRV